MSSSSKKTMKHVELTRRDFIKLSTTSVGVLSTGLGAIQAAAEPVPQDGSPLVDVDFDALVSRSDLVYLRPVDTNEPLTTITGVPIGAGCAGQPIGNGRMGTMVWTTPSTVQFQINRVDVFSANRNHTDGFGYKGGTTDYCGACAQVSIDVGGQPFGKGEHFRQHLSVYRAESQVQGDGVQVRCFVSAQSDVLVLEIDDQRSEPQPLRLTLSLWGEPSVKTGEHVARFAFVEDGKKYGVIRTFTEKEYYCRSAVAVQAGNSRIHVGSATATQRTFRIERATVGKTRILISSAASMDAKVDVAAQAFKVLDVAAGRSSAQLQTAHRTWWANFWARTFIHISSPDGVADFMERLRTTYLYIMASSSRGKFAPKWNGMLFHVDGDMIMLGCQYWNWTMEPLYISLYAAGASDLADPYFNMYVGMLPNAQIASVQRLNTKGAFIPEVVTFDGPVTLPDDVALEYRNLLTGAPGQGLSARAVTLGRYDIQLCYVGESGGRFTVLVHILTAGPRIAMHAWWRYRCTGDKAWLRTHAYPLLKNLAEFYRSYAVRRDDGRYHIEGTDVHESVVGIDDGIIDIAVIRGMVPLAARAAEILDVDADLRAAWREFVSNSAPYAMGSDPRSKSVNGGVLADDVWSVGHARDDVTSGDARGDEDPWVSPIFPFEDYTLERRDPEMTRIVKRVIDLSPIRLRAVERTLDLVTVARTPVAMVRAGLGEELPGFLSAYYCAFRTRLPNGFATFEAGDSSIEHLGMITMTLQEGLMQSLSPLPGEPEIIRVFPAWPKSWDGAFSLIARGGFLITSIRKDGVIPFVEIESRLGGTCQIHNPWNAPCFLTESGKNKQPQSGDILRFDTKAGKKYQLFLEKFPAPVRIAPARTPQASLSYRHANGTMIKERLGME